MTTHKHETRKLTDLTIHPLLKDSPMMHPAHPDCTCIRDSIQRHGLDEQPIVINDQNQIIDGRHRAREAGFLGWTEVPVVIRKDSDAPVIIFDTVMGRRHLYKWQVAYCLAPVLDLFTTDGKGVSMQNLIPGSIHKKRENPNVPSNGQTDRSKESDKPRGVGDTLSGIGISYETWQRVQEVRKRFAKRPDLKAQYEPRMFLPDSDDQGISLEGVMKALGSVESYEAHKHDVKALRGEHDRLALDLMKKAAAQLEFFDKLDPAKQKKLAEDTVQAVRLWPMELKKEILAALQQDFSNEQKHRKIK